MDSRRAKTIVSSTVMADVTCKSSPVYLESVNEKDQTCTIHYLGRPDKKETVPLTSLTEH